MKSLYPPQIFSLHNSVAFKTEGRRTVSVWVLDLVCWHCYLISKGTL